MIFDSVKVPRAGSDLTTPLVFVFTSDLCADHDLKITQTELVDPVEDAREGDVLDLKEAFERTGAR